MITAIRIVSVSLRLSLAGIAVGCAPPPDVEAPPLSPPKRPCAATVQSSLNGVSIVVTAPVCEFTLAEARKGIALPYEVHVTEPVEVRPSPQDAGGCGQPDAAGLIVFERLEGKGLIYDAYDTGLCPGRQRPWATIAPTVHRDSFTWDGRAWRGPSDTGQPKGEAFTPGTYTLTLKAIGTRRQGESEGPFEVETSVPITLTE
ncbi:MAG: hypothetical protein IV100_13995 [Myxococcales bacterium]|nr:hypothetical protein [Myxococcales bacterium]